MNSFLLKSESQIGFQVCFLLWYIGCDTLMLVKSFWTEASFVTILMQIFVSLSILLYSIEMSRDISILWEDFTFVKEWLSISDIAILILSSSSILLI